jgi:hypothetical protein
MKPAHGYACAIACRLLLLLLCCCLAMDCCKETIAICFEASYGSIIQFVVK